MEFEISYHNKDDIEFVTEFPYFLGHPVYTQYTLLKNTSGLAR